MRTKKTAPGVRDRKRQDQTRRDTNTKSSQEDTIITPIQKQGISAFLLHGKKNAISSADLIDTLNLSSQRELRHIIARARENGEIILSTTNGYFLPAPGEEGLQEIRDCVRVLRAKGISTLKAASAIKRPLRDIYGQQIIDALAADEDESILQQLPGGV